MSEEVKVKVEVAEVETKPEVKIEEVQPEVKEEVKEIKPEIKLSKFADIFVTEENTFDVTVRYYKEKEDLIVEGVSDSFDNKVDSIQFSATLKYPSQGDYAIIYSNIDNMSPGEEMGVREFLKIEFSRLACLLRSWTIDEKVSNIALMKMHPAIIKSMIGQIRDKIGMDGII